MYALQQQLSLSSLTEGLYKEILIQEDTGNIKTPIAQKYMRILGDTEMSFDDMRTEYSMEKHQK